MKVIWVDYVFLINPSNPYKLMSATQPESDTLPNKGNIFQRKHKLIATAFILQ